MVAKALVAVLCIGFLAGCVIVPLPKSADAVDVPLPDVRPHIPHDVQASGAEILLLARITRLHHASFFANRHTTQSEGPLLGAGFSRGTELEALKDKFGLKNSRRLLLMFFFLDYREAYYTDSLMLLCLVTADGRTFALTPGEKTWASMRQDRVDAAKREAFVAGIRAPSNKGMRNHIEGLCGDSGDVNWSPSLRSRVEEFLLRIPAAP